MNPLRVVTSIEEARKFAPKRSAVTLGVFDGVHLGHRRIVRALVELKKSSDVGGAYLITFDPHPLVVTHSKMTPPMLTTIDERLHLLQGFDLDGVVVLRFDRALAAVDYRTFIERYLLRPFDMSRLVLGYDCFFGRNREGSPEKASEEGERLGFVVDVVEARSEGSEVVSSTKIRNALMEGDFQRANRLLGHPYLLSGKVVKGNGKGRDLGFPTANLYIADPYKLRPPKGVYAVEVEVDGRRHRGMMNVGSAPTLKRLGDDAQEVEVHLFDVDEDLYGRTMWVYCRSYLRDERRFPSVEELVRQLKNDRKRALEYLQGD